MIGMMTSAPRADVRPPRRSGADPRILIVDPDPGGDVLASRLAESGYDTAVVNTVSGARALLARQPFAALVTDLVLPDGGRRWLAQLRAERPQLMVLVVAAEPIESLGLDRVYGLADAVLSKPTQPEIVTAVLDRVIDWRGAT